MSNSFSIIRQGLDLFTSLITRRAFLWSYLLCYGLFDIFSALYSAARVDDLVGQTQLALYVCGNLSIFMSVLVLLILNGSRAVFTKQTWRLMWKTWVANLVAGCFIILGFICLIIPGIILTLRYLYINQAIVVEDLTIRKALTRSRQLSAANAGRTLWAIIIAFVFYAVFSIAFYVLVDVIGGSAALNSFAFNYIFELITSAGTILMAVFTYVGYLDACAITARSRPDPNQPSASGSQPSLGTSRDRLLGQTYAKVLASCPEPSPQRRQALLQDLLGDDRSLWPALRHLIEQPAFAALVTDESPATRAAVKDSLLEEMAGQYLPQVVERIREFTTGLLDS